MRRRSKTMNFSIDCLIDRLEIRGMHQWIDWLIGCTWDSLGHSKPAATVDWLIYNCILRKKSRSLNSGQNRVVIKFDFQYFG